jgi:DNA-binding XRE family transcriptional regulator
MSIKNLSDYKANSLKDPEFAKEYNDLDLQYKIIHELLHYRIENNITQDELSRRTGISKSNISRFESGKHSPTLKMIYRIANGLGKKINFNFLDKDNGNTINI